MEIPSEEAAAFAFFTKEFWLVAQFVVPLLGFFLIKNYFLNFVAFIIIKLNTDFQFHNDFEMDGRHCKMLSLKSQYVMVWDFDNRQSTKVGTREFLKQRVWVNEPEKEIWSDTKRKDHRKKLKEKK